MKPPSWKYKICSAQKPSQQDKKYDTLFCHNKLIKTFNLVYSFKYIQLFALHIAKEVFQYSRSAKQAQLKLKSKQNKKYDTFLKSQVNKNHEFGMLIKVQGIVPNTYSHRGLLPREQCPIRTLTHDCKSTDVLSHWKKHQQT